MIAYASFCHPSVSVINTLIKPIAYHGYQMYRTTVHNVGDAAINLKVNMSPTWPPCCRISSENSPLRPRQLRAMYAVPLATSSSLLRWLYCSTVRALVSKGPSWGYCSLCCRIILDHGIGPTQWSTIWYISDGCFEAWFILITQPVQMVFALNTGLLTSLCSAGSLISVKALFWYVSSVIDVFFIATGGSKHISLYRLYV